MTKNIEILKWELYLLKKKMLYDYGLQSGLIRTYDDELIMNLREVYYEGIPASVMLLCNKLCNGHCYDRALLITFGFGDDNFQLVDATIDGIALNPLIISKYNRIKEKGFKCKYPYNHWFVERTKKDGSVWIYDTSVGLVFEKNLYYKIEDPRIIKINSKEDTLNYFEYKAIKNSCMEKDKYMLPIILSDIENLVNSGDEIYESILKREIDILRNEIWYDNICQEVNETMKITRKF